MRKIEKKDKDGKVEFTLIITDLVPLDKMSVLEAEAIFKRLPGDAKQSLCGGQLSVWLRSKANTDFKGTLSEFIARIADKAGAVTAAVNEVKSKAVRAMRAAGLDDVAIAKALDMTKEEVKAVK